LALMLMRRWLRPVGTALLALGICASCGSSHATPTPLRVGKSYLGLDCGDAFPCPKLGIALWLRAPERSVTVTLHGRWVALTTHRRYKYRRYWQGFVRDMVAERLAGDMNREVRLTVVATGSDGTIRRATLTSPVSPGWG
jgi:hypothetical protein